MYRMIRNPLDESNGITKIIEVFEQLRVTRNTGNITKHGKENKTGEESAED